MLLEERDLIADARLVVRSEVDVEVTGVSSGA